MTVIWLFRSRSSVLYCFSKIPEVQARRPGVINLLRSHKITCGKLNIIFRHLEEAQLSVLTEL
jgi:hypothetical protein